MHLGLKRSLYLVLVVMAGWQSWAQAKTWPLSDTQTKQWGDTAVPFHAAVDQAFIRHQVVMLGDYHWNESVMSTYIQLLKQPSFLDKVKNVVVEFGNGRHQNALDDYLNGVTKDESILNDVRRDALYFTAWMPDVYVDFFNTVRRYNLAVSDSEKVKVWLAEAPFYWEQVQKASDWQQAADTKTEGFMAVAEKAIQTKGKVLMIFGAFHLLDVTNAPKDVPLPLGTRLKQAYPKRIFTVWPITDPAPSEILSFLLAPSLLFNEQLPLARLQFVDILPKATARLGTYSAQDASVEQLVDGLLYLGKSQQRMQFPKSVLKDKAWLATMEARITMIGGRALSAYRKIIANSKK